MKFLSSLFKTNKIPSFEFQRKPLLFSLVFFYKKCLKSASYINDHVVPRSPVLFLNQKFCSVTKPLFIAQFEKQNFLESYFLENSEKLLNFENIPSGKF